MERRSEAGAIRVRSVIEIVFLFTLAYTVIQVAPAVVLRVNFLNELEVLANAPVQEDAGTIRRKVLETAEGYGIALFSDELHVARDRSQNRTTIDARYQLHINFWPKFTYVWNVHDRVEALTF